MEGLTKTILEETGTKFVFGNKTFKEKYMEYIKYKIDLVTIKLNTPGDLQAHQSYMTLLINYALYSKLFSDEDSKIYKRIWSLQKQCPIIILYNNLCLNPGQFLFKKCPLKKATTCDPPDLDKFMKSELAIKDEQFVSKLDATYVKLVHWIVQMNSDVMQDAKIEDKDQAIQTEFLKQRANLII